jgi:hypothetical protein
VVARNWKRRATGPGKLDARFEGWDMPYRTLDDLDAAIIMLAATAYDVAERDLDVPGNSEQLRAVALAILRHLEEREQLTTVQPVTV